MTWALRIRGADISVTSEAGYELDGTSGRAPRTLLEAIILGRRQSFDEFSEDAETFAREHDESATLGTRHLQRLASGTRADGRPLGPVRPATRRLLEEMLGHPITDLLGPAPERGSYGNNDGERRELAARLAAARTIDSETIAAFRQRIDLARVVDRRLGSNGLIAELSEQIQHIRDLGRYAIDSSTKRALASVVADTCTLVGWQWIDRADLLKAWHYYAEAISAAGESESVALMSYTVAGQSVVLLEAGEVATAQDMTEHARSSAHGKVPHLLMAWLSAAHGEACAANGERAQTEQAFDEAERLLDRSIPEDVPFLVFGRVHLARWRGTALVRLGEPRAIEILNGALTDLDGSFTRAETAVRADLVEAYQAIGEPEAVEPHARKALRLAEQIGSVRHRRRVSRAVSPPVSRKPSAWATRR